MIDNLSTTIEVLSVTEISAVALAVAYLVLAIRQNIWCWPAQLLSSCLYMSLFFAASLYMESVLQVFYASMAVYGWRQWRYGGEKSSGVRIHVWSFGQHFIALIGILGVSMLLGWGMSHTGAAFPYADSLTTVAAILATYMVARKVLENWIYWFVIDSISIYLYVARELYLTALLFFLYIILIFIGFRSWWRDYQNSSSCIQGGHV